MRVIFVFLIAVISTLRPLYTQNILENKSSHLEGTAVYSPVLTNTSHNVAYNTSSEYGRFSYLDAIEQDLLHQNWEEREQPCLRQLLKIIANVQNSTLWATWIWDSMQFPVGQLYGSRNHLGNYDQCLDLPWKEHPELRTQYCLAEIQFSEVDPEVTMDLLGSVEKYIRYKTKHGLSFNHLTWGICAPVICKSESISKFTDAMFKSTHLGRTKTQYNISVNSAHCQIAGELPEKGVMEYIFLSLIIVLIIMTLLCTWYVSFVGAESKYTSNFAKAFNLKSNAQHLMKVENKSIRSVLGIRLVSNFVIAASHLWITKNVFGVGNAAEIDKKWDDSIQCIKFNSEMIVDIYFMISGLLLTKSILEKKMNTFNPFIVIFKRYIRFICSLTLILLMLPIVLLYGESGPLVKKYLHYEVDAWATNWWKNVLMIGNYGDTENISYAVLWSLACDFQLFVIGILILVVYRKSKKAGTQVYVICAVASVMMPVIYGFKHNSGAVISFNFGISDNYRKYLIGDPAYVRTHLRAGPYFVGLAVGYLMARFQPEKYRNVMSKKPSVLAFFTFFFMFASVNYLCGIYHVREYSSLEGALFSVARRNVFAALIGFLILICEYGSLPFISSALSWPGLAPLSKLSYGVYLTHLMFTFRFVARTRVPLRSDAIDDLYSTFGMMAVTFTVSLLMWLFWEAPLMNLIDMIFKRFVEKNIQNGNLKVNKILNFTSEEYEQHIEHREEKKLN